MNITSKAIKKFQEGGQMEQTTPQEAPQQAQGAGQDPIMQMAQLFAQGLQNQDCNMLAQGAQMFLQLLQSQSQGAAPAPQGEPAYRKGGILVQRV